MADVNDKNTSPPEGGIEVGVGVGVDIGVDIGIDADADHPSAIHSMRISFPEELPITAHVEEIRSLLASNQVIIVAGETGSGKTTQLPKICLAAGFGVKGMIGHTQPRRIAARSVAIRIAEELGVEPGMEVGYAFRFTTLVSEHTRVKLMTDGLLLTEIRRDKLLSAYDVVIIDEAHERSLNVDFLLGCLKQLLTQRTDLRVIITSATIDVEAFSRHFDAAPVVEVGGRTYPVEMRYLAESTEVDDPDTRLLSVLEDIETGPQLRARDILMFLSGEREIMETARLLRTEVGDRFEILPLYARLSSSDQQRVFKPGKRRRIVLATNVAETSLTVPNIGYVIDPGFARVSRYSYRSKLQRLPIEPISQASANQRAGRCGRIAPGVCFRLYSEDDFASRPAFTDPEIQRSNLASVVLQMLAFRLGDPSSFPFLDPPDPRAIRDAEKLLSELGALQGKRLTETGRRMARLPIDPRLARMLIEADRRRSLTEALIIASALAVADPRDRPIEKQAAADRAHAQWIDEKSDFVTFLNLWNWFETTRQALTRGELRKQLKRQFLSSNRMYEWRELHRQLLLVAKQMKMRLNNQAADFSSIHRALLSGSLSLIGVHEERGQYLGPRNLHFRIFPGSALARRSPKWLMAGEMVETRRVYARSVAAVEARWIEEAAGQLLKRQHSEPHWSLKRGEAIAYEKVSLYGLVLVERRAVSYRSIDPVVSRELLILEGLVRGAINNPPGFLTRNLQSVTQIKEAEEKGRRRDLLADDAEVAALYDELLPQSVITVRDLMSWSGQQTAEQLNRLILTREQLSHDPRVAYSAEDFPMSMTVQGKVFPISYRFAPGEADDGVSIAVPMGLLNVVVPQLLDWSVPGLLGGVCEQWIRSLPKQKRRQLAPVPDSVARILPGLLQEDVYRQGRFDKALSDAIEFEFSIRLDPAEWVRERVDAQWRVNVQVLDSDGTVIAQSRDVTQLQQTFAQQLAQRMDDGLREQFEEPDLVEFPDQSIVAAVTLGSAGSEVVAYPALVDEGETVALRHLLDQQAQALANRDGYARLALLKLGSTTRYLRKQLNADKALGLLYAPLGGADLLQDEVLRATAWQCFFEGRKLPEDAASFAECLQQNRSALASCCEQILKQLRAILDARMILLEALSAAASPAYAEAVEDVRAQLDELVSARLLCVTPAEYLGEIPRYLEAARRRISNLQGKVVKDRQQMQVVAELADRIERIHSRESVELALSQTLRFQLEEVRVGLFAESMGARGKASPKRLSERLSEIERELGLI